MYGHLHHWHRKQQHSIEVLSPLEPPAFRCVASRSELPFIHFVATLSRFRLAWAGLGLGFLTALLVQWGETLLQAHHSVLPRHQALPYASKVGISQLKFNALPHPARAFRRGCGGAPCPQLVDFDMRDEATPLWRQSILSGRWNDSAFARAPPARVPPSIYYPPTPPISNTSHDNNNKGYILVAVTSCCRSWNLTRALLQALLSLDDPIHVILIDDNSDDGTPELASAMGIPVLTTLWPSGLTASMNRAGQYFLSFASLQALFVVNNDVRVSQGCFTKLHRCAMRMPRHGVVGPVTDAQGAPGVSTQIAASDSSMRRYYNGTRAPHDVRHGLPDTLAAYNTWLETARSRAPPGAVFPAHTLMGFVLGFRKDFPLLTYDAGLLLSGGISLHQEFFLFGKWAAKAYVCPDSFVYHVKAATSSGASAAPVREPSRVDLSYW